MAENSKIEWTDHTFNGWIGCTKVGPPCDHCYAETLSNRYGWVTWGPHGERKRTSLANWKKPLQWAKAARVSGTRPRVFAFSLADWLDNQVPQRWREDLGDLICATPELDWLLLTKRMQNYQRLAPWLYAPANVWFGITCGSQPELDRDWPFLERAQASVRFISYEPALGPMVLGKARPDWIICGGESGPHARPMRPDWARRLRDECQQAGVAFFFKQHGQHLPHSCVTWDHQGAHTLQTLGKPSFEAHGERFWSVGKKAAGRLLDGREHNEMPAPRTQPAEAA